MRRSLERDLGVGLAWAIVLVCALARALATFTPIPYYADADPIFDPPLLTGLEPASILALDLVTFAACGVALALDSRRRGVSWIAVLMWTVGLLGVGWHVHAGRGDQAADSRIGFGWASALAAGLVSAHVGRDERRRRLTLAVGLGVVAMLASKGLLQVLVEHADSVENYRLNRDAILRSQGWLPGSPNARMFERRLMQREATGWFGLSNVYATFAGGIGAMCACLLAGMLLSQSGSSRVRFGVAIGAAAGIAGVGLSHSKGGVAALGFGVLCFVLAASWMIKRGAAPRWSGAVALAAIVVPLVAITARSVIGERLGELSLLFRSFYARTAARIFLDHSLTGVGPGGFKPAYSLAKPALSPEEVDSPHSILMDYAATLGLPGIAWCGLFVVLVLACGRALTPIAIGQTVGASPKLEGVPGTARARAYAIAAIAIVPTVVSAWFERQATPAESAIARIAGLAGWIGVALSIEAGLRAMPERGWGKASARGLAGAGIAAGALALIAHAQIELTPTHATAAPLFMILVGAAASPGLRDRAPRRASTLLASAAFGLAIVLAAPAAIGFARQRQLLRAASEQLGEIAEFNALLRAQADEPSIMKINQRLQAAIGPDAPRNASPFTLFNVLLVKRASAGVHLDKAAETFPRSPALHELASSFWLSQSGAGMALHQELPAFGFDEVGVRAMDRAVELSRDAATRWPHLPGVWTHLASVLEARSKGAARGSDPSSDLAEAIAGFEKAAQLDPRGSAIPRRLALLLSDAGDAEGASRWAEQALHLDRNLRLDPIRQFSEADRARLESLAARRPEPK